MKLENLVFGVCLFVSAAPAWAYLDPGSISLWLQGIIAAVAALAATFRFWWYRLLQLLGRGKRDDTLESTGAGRGE